MRGRWVGWFVVLLLMAASLLLLDPARLGLSTAQPFAQLVALRGSLALGAVLCAAALLFCVLLVRHRGESRPIRLFIAFVVLMLFAGANVGVLVARGVSASTALPRDKAPGDIDILAFNTYYAIDSPAAISELVARHDADAVMLPETSRRDALKIAGDDYALFMSAGDPGASAPTALLVATSMGEYKRITGPDTEYGLVGASPIDGDGPILYAVHVVSPIPARMSLWRDELDLVMGICQETDDVIMAGDFNATVDHAPLRDASCVDGSVGSGAVGTWPAGMPALLGAPIDHVFADPAAWKPVASAIAAMPRSDHRALLVRLRSV